ncbi:MAG: 5'/3'-nucleotidase SurE [Armatimonadetes bacterium]|nr:5'/3'-nucleotidase SurE [Armatimonadota bacterium]
MRILVTNDDGIHAAGLVALVRALRDVGEVTVVAPERERSAVSHAISLHDPLRAWPVSFEGAPAWAVNGMPADCVLLGSRELMEAPPDVVVSGINRGANLGEDVWYSGTVSAAMEGTILGFPAVAFSVCCGREAPDFRAAAIAATQLVPLAAEHLPDDTLLNVNVPNLAPERIEGAELCHQGRRRYQTTFDKRIDPRGGIYYWIGTGDPQDEPLPGTDVGAVAARRIAITPIRLDLTAVDSLEALADWPNSPWRAGS